eukprot:scaffold4602_cov86-Isochrysis_galbana.AAC.2
MGGMGKGEGDGPQNKRQAARGRVTQASPTPIYRPGHEARPPHLLLHPPPRPEIDQGDEGVCAEHQGQTRRIGHRLPFRQRGMPAKQDPELGAGAGAAGGEGER